jgi:hypothetical protein
MSLRVGRAIAQGVSRWLPRARGPCSSRGLVKWDLWWIKWRWGRFSPSTSVSPANIHSTKFSILAITRGRHNRPIRGRRAEWTQFGLHPPLCEFNFVTFGSGKILGISQLGEPQSSIQGSCSMKLVSWSKYFSKFMFLKHCNFVLFHQCRSPCLTTGNIFGIIGFVEGAGIAQSE